MHPKDYYELVLMGLDFCKKFLYMKKGHRICGDL